MDLEELRPDDRVLAFIDPGTNSIHMSVVRIKANQAYAILREGRRSSGWVIMSLAGTICRFKLLVSTSNLRVI